MAEPSAKTMPLETQLETDELILDYLLYSSSALLLAGRRTPENAADSSLTMSMLDAFLVIFRTHHPEYKPSPVINLRLHLVRFLTLVTQRYRLTEKVPPEEALQALRQSNSERAERFWHSTTFPSFAAQILPLFHARLPVQSSFVERNRAMVLSSLSIHDSESFYGTPRSISLLDTLPSFMSLSATVLEARSEWNVNSAWMVTAAEFMLQAALESALVFGSTDVSTLQEAFAWGFEERGDLEEGTVEWDVNAMFYDEMYYADPTLDGLTKWEKTRDKYMQLVFSNPEGDVEQHLENLMHQFPLERFETKLLGYLEAILNCVPRPILTQLEHGKLNGFSINETADFMELVGIY